MILKDEPDVQLPRPFRLNRAARGGIDCAVRAGLPRMPGTPNMIRALLRLIGVLFLAAAFILGVYDGARSIAVQAGEEFVRRGTAQLLAAQVERACADRVGGGHATIARQPAQTPSEFVQDLEGAWPEAELDVEALTGAFLTARYDAAEISPNEAQQVKSVWERIKRALRGNRKAGASQT